MADDFNLFKWLGGIFTDALGRPEVKMILGIPCFITGIVYVISTRDLAVAGFISGNSITLMGFTAVADHKIDVAQIAAGGK